MTTKQAHSYEAFTSDHISFISLLIAGAVHTRTAGAALALAATLSCWNPHHNILDVALVSLDDIDAVAFLHALATVSAVAVAALVRHGER